MFCQQKNIKGNCLFKISNIVSGAVSLYWVKELATFYHQVGLFVLLELDYWFLFLIFSHFFEHFVLILIWIHKHNAYSFIPSMI